MLDTNFDPARVGDPVNNAVRMNCVVGCGGGGGGGTSSTFGAAFPATGTAAGFFDGVNMQGGRVFDGDTGGGTEFNIGVILRRPASGGSVLFGTTTDPFQVQSNNANLATETTLGTRLADTTFTGRINTLGQKTMANSTPVVLPSDQTVSVNQTTFTLLATGQQAVTTTATALPSNVGREVCLRTLSSGTQTVFYGITGVTVATGQELLPGDKHCAPVSNSNQFFVIAGSAGSTVAFEVYQ